MGHIMADRFGTVTQSFNRYNTVRDRFENPSQRDISKTANFVLPPDYPTLFMELQERETLHVMELFHFPLGMGKSRVPIPKPIIMDNPNIVFIPLQAKYHIGIGNTYLTEPCAYKES